MITVTGKDGNKYRIAADGSKETTSQGLLALDRALGGGFPSQPKRCYLSFEETPLTHRHHLRPASPATCKYHATAEQKKIMQAFAKAAESL